ncbi:MAG: 3-deoxy-D-manno-octulosonic acid transferase [Syntrophobacteraceae bacterium]
MGLILQTARITYNTVLFSIWPALYLYYFCRSRTDGKYCENFGARMGLELPAPAPCGTKRLWFHALSLGEVLSAVPLIREVRRICPGYEIFVSTATETGMSLARKRLSELVDFFFFMPHDFPWAVEKLVKRIRPALFVLVETDFWPNLLMRLNRESIAKVLVNGRMSPASFRKYSRPAGFTWMIFEQFDLVFAQTELDRERFVALGVHSEKSIAAGNLKLDSSVTKVSQTEIESIRTELDLSPDRLVWVAGSTHQGEEEILLRVHGELKLKAADPLLIIAPRNVKRRVEIESLCKDLGFTFGTRSRGEGAKEKSVFLLDTLGELAKIYAISNVAFLGGSFVPLGGHNPLEVIARGKPACWGPHFFNFSEIETDLLNSGCGVKVGSEHELADFVGRILSDSCESDRMSEAAEKFAGFQRKTAERIAATLIVKLSNA